jgi:DNA-binding LacI/PurR family transcriptional regulator
VVQYTRKDGVAAMTRLLDARRSLDAVFCAAGDACATGMLAVARERGIKVPEQIAVMGYDDSPLASISDPPLTTVRQPLDQIAREAHRLATEAPAELLARPRTILLEPTLVKRASA